MMAITTAPRIKTVPVSFCTKMMAVGIAATMTDKMTSRALGSSSMSRRSDNRAAIIKMTETFANSDGWMVSPSGTSIHARAPAMVTPSPGTKGTSNNSIEAT